METSEIFNVVLNKFLLYVEKLEGLVGEHAQESWNLVIKMAFYENLWEKGLLTFFLMLTLSFSLWILRAIILHDRSIDLAHAWDRQPTKTGKRPKIRYEKVQENEEILIPLAVFSGVIAACIFLGLLLDFWGWVAVFDTELYMIRQLVQNTLGVP